MRITWEVTVIDIPKAPAIVMPENNGIWRFPEDMEKGVGFIYLIRDNVLNRFYLGKKLYHGWGKLNKGKTSNWRTYTSSSPVMNELIEERPWEEFDFICIEQYATKATLSYAETWTLCWVEAPTTVDWYNKRIEKVTWPVKEGISDRHKSRLFKAISMEDFL